MMLRFVKPSAGTLARSASEGDARIGGDTPSLARRASVLHRRAAGLCIAACFLSHAYVLASEEAAPTVGISTRLDQVVLSGTELEVKPLTDRGTPVVVRIVEVYPHGTSFRYDLEYYGLAPGAYDLKDFLRRKDGSSAADLPAIPIEIRSVLPPGQIEPHALTPEKSPPLGGYRRALWVGGVLWVIGLAAILLLGRKSRRQAASAQPPRTLADRLRPLVERAQAGTLTAPERGELERMLLAFWGRRLGLTHLDPSQVLAEMRKHPDAGRLIEQLELWLHRPDTADQVDVTALLAPYREEVNGPTSIHSGSTAGRNQVGNANHR